jgi:two-component system response regulator NreC
MCVAGSRRLFKTGVTGYLVKRSAADELLTAIRVVARGERFIGSHLHGQAIDQWTSPDAAQPRASTNTLSDREQAVLQLIAAGMTSKEIAGQLDVSIKSVETYKSRAMQKLNLSGRTDIVRYALSQKWLEPS